MSLKEYSQIPLHIVEDHNEALSFILRGIGSKHLEFENNLLIHFDSHPDLLINTDLKPEDVCEKESLLEKVSIETWILPLAYAGHVSTIVWIKPKWSNQIEEGKHSLHIGHNKEGEIKVSSPLLYFVSALNYAPQEELSEPKKIDLVVLTLDLSQESVTKCKSEILKLIQAHKNYLLDIDLDFFSTLNPFVEMFPDVKMYERLKLIYKFEKSELVKSSASEAQRQRKSQIDSLEQIFKALEELKDSEERIEKVSEIVASLKDKSGVNILKELILDLCKTYGDEVDWDIVHNAGTTIDDPDTELPHHVSTEQEILSYVDHFGTVIKAFPAPRMISMARSSLDDYCPPSIVDFIQEKVSKILCDIHNPEILKHYEEVVKESEEPTQQT